MESNEIQIPVPWGIIAAKTWGNKNDPLVLTMHGWVDNANSFDTLIPLLPRCFYYVCIDLPGHGRSSVVDSLIIRDMDYIIVLKLIYNYFQREKITIIGHSLGGLITLLFSQFYPECVSKIVIFDVFYFFLRPPHSQFGKLLHHYNQRIKFLPKESKDGPVYTKEEIITRMMKSRILPTSRKAIEILVDRGIKPAGNNTYRMTVASNVKHMIFTSLPPDSVVDIIQKYPIQCPHLLILSSSSNSFQTTYRKAHDVYRNNPNYEFHLVEGTHNVHMENPERVASMVEFFLLKHQNKL